ncbi:hypothetical protein SDRG_00631 [Saprolegnia diclina VS20]|uniref:Uncharacterized protein n=1 Tax=Saprolegnia diclina (strain VS20) TaxID=1156394 RepID=T0S8Y6_SAPDV|nr:hypothetical protein SDRG_00631 [Saprolegnia diclina VS20]EQC41768.1 hypothetical protein SDRG_00631 [Saprolegnia diclina VS20]|eukprot:XP_008604337.1 hypothetical protein SDRG_00631 [Saprolegnia diclina VS20]
MRVFLRVSNFEAIGPCHSKNRSRGISTSIMLRAPEKGRVEKKGRFTIIDLPSDVPSPSAAFGHDTPTSLSNDDAFDADAPLQKTRVKQKGRFTIIDLNPTTPSPERNAHKTFEDEREKVPEAKPRAPLSTPLTVDQSLARIGAHAHACCHHRASLVHNQANDIAPLCTLPFPTESNSQVIVNSPVVVLPLAQYQQQLALLSTLQQENRDLHTITATLQDQQRQLFELLRSFQKASPPSPMP